MRDAAFIGAVHHTRARTSGHLVTPNVAIGKGTLIRKQVGVWTNATATVVDVFCETGADFALRFDRASLVMPLEEVGGRLELAHLSTDETIDPVGWAPLYFIPAGYQVTVRSTSVKFVTLFALDIEPVHQIMGADEPTLISNEIVGINETRLSNLCRLLAQECRGPAFNGTAYADNLVLALGIALSRFDDNDPMTGFKGGLAPWQLRRVQEYMLENLAETISVKVLADLAQISMTHLSRAFKASVGCAPHQWMTRNRIDKAKRYLIAGDIPIVEISLCLGFCDQAHFTRVFKKAVGDTPLEWQRTRRC